MLVVPGKVGAAFLRKRLADEGFAIDEVTADWLPRLDNEDLEESEKSDKCSSSTTKMESVISSKQGCSSNGHSGQEQTR